MAALQPQDLAFADTAPVRIDGAARSTAGPDDVWAVLLDHSSWPTWFGRSIRRCEATSDPATGVGATRRVTLTGATPFDETFIAWEPGSVWAFTVTAGPGAFRSLVERCTLTPDGDGGTGIAYRMAFDPKPALKPLVPVLRLGIGRALDQGMAGLAAEAERRTR